LKGLEVPEIIIDVIRFLGLLDEASENPFPRKDFLPCIEGSGKNWSKKFVLRFFAREK
jgi:hypothetical protein